MANDAARAYHLAMMWKDSPRAAELHANLAQLTIELRFRQEQEPYPDALPGIVDIIKDEIDEVHQELAWGAANA
jgi:hypothetical protein